MKNWLQRQGVADLVAVKGIYVGGGVIISSHAKLRSRTYAKLQDARTASSQEIGERRWTATRRYCKLIPTEAVRVLEGEIIHGGVRLEFCMFRYNFWLKHGLVSFSSPSSVPVCATLSRLVHLQTVSESQQHYRHSSRRKHSSWPGPVDRGRAAWRAKKAAK